MRKSTITLSFTLSLLAMLFIVACSSTKYYDKPVAIEYKSVFHSNQFFTSLPYVAEQNQYILVETNTENGTALLKRSALVKENAVEIQITVKFDDKTDMVSLKVKALVSGKENQNVEYYDDKLYNKDYEDIYLPMIKSLKEFCTKSTYPNRP